MFFWKYFISFVLSKFLIVKACTMRTIYEILQQKGPHFNYVNATDFVIDALTLMKSENISYLIVRDKENYVGIISERDYAQKVILMGKHSDTTLVREIMTIDLPIVSETDTTEQCMILMNASKSRYLPVFDGLNFKGVITIHDLMRESIAENQNRIANTGKKSSRYYWV
jgi:signal-transduction protein with cAMP-binding, CBS, and nucleotidyltransferase domain